LTSRLTLLVTALLFLALSTIARAADVAVTPRIEVRLISEMTGVPASGGTISLGLLQRMQPGWHTYWRNPGESGEPTTINWLLPPGYTASTIIWPHPERIPFGELANYGYSDHVLLRAEITVPPGLRAGDTVSVTAHATWLVCKDVCIPEKATLDLALPVVDTPAPASEHREAFAEARAKEPVANGPITARFAATDDNVTLFFQPALNRLELGKGALFFPHDKGLIKASALQIADPAADGFVISVPPAYKLRDPQKRAGIAEIAGVLVLAPDGQTPSQAFAVTLQRGAVPAVAPKTAAAADLGLVQAILFAVLGGLILNLMPCVFPILSMKALALVRAGHTEHPWADGVAYLAGVMTTFAALAGALLWFRSIGADVGWGFQLQSPLSVAVLAYVITLVGLNLSGVFNIGGSVQGSGQGLTSRGGLVGAFFTGILAVVVAAPCTAPFMGAAMGFAFTQSPAVTIAIFLALGFGLALPWVLFSFSPALVRLLPKPGEWMERFKQFLAFPMYGAAAWLVWVLSQQVDPEGLFRVMIGLILLALAAWAFGVAQARAALSRSIVLSSIIFLVSLGAAAALIALPFKTRTAEPQATEAGAALSQPFSTSRLSALRAEGKPVFVNLTAAWCVSCLYNERVALSTANVVEAFKATGTTYLVGDWTNQNPEISALLREHGREGVPLYLYFPAGGGAPKILPQILTEALMLETLGKTR
jgi:thiol:disulfide interchange protein/DsbC/DsbD-like thiol-disulfide interchange protein